MQKLRIGFVVNNLIVGGVSKVLISLCNSLDINKYDIYIFILSNDTQMEKYIQLNSNVNRYIFNYSFKNSYTSISYLKSAFLKSDTKIRAKKIIEGITKLNLDVLHFHTLPRQLPIGQLILKKNPKIKLIFTDHSVRISAIEYKTHQKFLLKIAYSRFYKNFNIIAVSKKVYNSITQNNLNDASKKIKILENSISISDYNRTKKIDTNSFIYISRITDQKGHRTLINAWKSIKNKEKGTLYIIGPDESNGAIIQLAKNDKTIVFTGSISNIKDYLNNSTVGIFPSQKEGLPLSLLEKMAYSIPVIVSDIPELTSIISDQVEGLHFKLDNTKDLKSKIEYAINNKNGMIRLGMNARKRVEEICSINDPIAFHDNFYLNL